MPVSCELASDHRPKSGASPTMGNQSPCPELLASGQIRALPIPGTTLGVPVFRRGVLPHFSSSSLWELWKSRRDFQELWELVFLSFHSSAVSTGNGPTTALVESTVRATGATVLAEKPDGSRWRRLFSGADARNNGCSCTNAGGLSGARARSLELITGARARGKLQRSTGSSARLPQAHEQGRIKDAPEASDQDRGDPGSPRRAAAYRSDSDCSSTRAGGPAEASDRR